MTSIFFILFIFLIDHWVKISKITVSTLLYYKTHRFFIGFCVQSFLSVVYIRYTLIKVYFLLLASISQIYVEHSFLVLLHVIWMTVLMNKLSQIRYFLSLGFDEVQKLSSNFIVIIIIVPEFKLLLFESILFTLLKKIILRYSN